MYRGIFPFSFLSPPLTNVSHINKKQPEKEQYVRQMEQQKTG
jgi:hypothetical protein